MFKKVYSEEIINYAVKMLEDGADEVYVRDMVKEKYGLEVGLKTVTNWFMLKRQNLWNDDIEKTTVRERKEREAATLKRRMKRLKTELKLDDVIVYKDYVSDDGMSCKYEKAKVIKLYKYYILTNKGAIQYADVKGVL